MLIMDSYYHDRPAKDLYGLDQGGQQKGFFFSKYGVAKIVDYDFLHVFLGRYGKSSAFL